MTSKEILLNLVYDRNSGYCFYCDMRLSFQNYGIVGAKGAWEIDHFVPLSRNGANRITNLVPACVACNTEKSDQMPWEFDPFHFPYGERDPERC